MRNRREVTDKHEACRSLAAAGRTGGKLVQELGPLWLWMRWRSVAAGGGP